MLGTFVKNWYRYESDFVHGRDYIVDILKERGLLSESDSVQLFFFSSRRRHTRLTCDWSSDVCSSDLFRLRKPPRSFSRPMMKPGRSPRRRSSLSRSEERRVGKECRSRWSPNH